MSHPGDDSHSSIHGAARPRRVVPPRPHSRSGAPGPSRALPRYRVSLANRQRRVSVRTDRLRRLAARVLRAAVPGGGELSVLLVDDTAIAQLNAAYRGRPQPTDVLSFSQLEGATPTGAARAAGDGLLLGDVVISAETARRQARSRGRPLGEEIAALLIHGVLHLLGYDHERDREAARRMFARERAVAEAIGLPPLALGDRPRRNRRGETR